MKSRSKYNLIARYRRTALFVMMILTIFLLYGCAPQPIQEIADAEVSLAAARDAQAERYTPDEYGLAEATFKLAREEVRRNHFARARELAVKSKTIALSTQKNSKKRLIDQIRKTIQAAKDAQTAAKIAGGEKHDPDAFRMILALIGESEMAFSANHFTIAIDKAELAEMKARRLELATRRAVELEEVNLQLGR